MPVAVVRDATGRATALRVVQCEAKMVGGKLDVKPIEGTEQDIEADLIVSAIGQAVDFTGLEVLNNGKGGVSTDKQLPGEGTAGRVLPVAT
jgi:NADPH-dependent glutamate synthase beta subunit-like oxidoreductase